MLPFCGSELILSVKQLISILLIVILRASQRKCMLREGKGKQHVWCDQKHGEQDTVAHICNSST